jgi:hypothetical protein
MVGSAASVRMRRQDLDRWMDDGGSMIVDSFPVPLVVTSQPFSDMSSVGRGPDSSL